MHFGRLSNLAFVARLDIPLDVLRKHGPPEPDEQSNSNRIYSLMTEFVVRFFDQLVSSFSWDNQLVSTVRIASPKLVVQ
jgi:hypothetical protein